VPEAVVLPVLPSAARPPAGAGDPQSSDLPIDAAPAGRDSFRALLARELAPRSDPGPVAPGVQGSAAPGGHGVEGTVAPVTGEWPLAAAPAAVLPFAPAGSVPQTPVPDAQRRMIEDFVAAWRESGGQPALPWRDAGATTASLAAATGAASAARVPAAFAGVALGHSPFDTALAAGTAAAGPWIAASAQQAGAVGWYGGALAELSPPSAAGMPADGAVAGGVVPAGGSAPGSPAAERAATVSVAVPFGRAEWQQSFGDRVSWLVTQHIQVAELQIDPPQLGPVEIRISLVQGEATLSFAAAQAPVREAIQQALPRLAEMLAAGGLTLGDVSVGAESFFGQPSPDSHAAAMRSPGAAVPGVEPGGEPAAGAAGVTVNRAAAYGGTGLIDMFV
jgi:flagellar hook-length control protein FliK